MKFFIVIYFLISFFFLSQNFKTKEESIKDGYEIYQDFCLRCHMHEGEGSKGIPPLANSDYLFNDIENSIDVVKNGMKDINVTNTNEIANKLGFVLEQKDVASVGV